MSNEKEQMSVESLLDNGVKPNTMKPKSKRLDAAIEAAEKLNVIELTYLFGEINTALEVYRAQLTHDIFGAKTDNEE